VSDASSQDTEMSESPTNQQDFLVLIENPDAETEEERRFFLDC